MQDSDHISDSCRTHFPDPYPEIRCAENPAANACGSNDTVGTECSLMLARLRQGSQQNTYATTHRPVRVRIPVSAALFATASAAFHDLELFDVACAVLTEHAHLARPPALRPTAGVTAGAAARGVAHRPPRATQVLPHVLFVDVFAARRRCGPVQGCGS